MPEVCRPRGPGTLRPSPPPTTHRHQHRCPRRGPSALLLRLPRALSTAGQRGLGHGRGGGPRARSGACFLCSCSASKRTWPAVVAWQPQGAPGLGRTLTPMTSPGPRASIRWAPGTVEFFVGAGGRPRGCGAWGPGGSPGQGPRQPEPSSQEGLGQATPGWEAGGTSAAGHVSPCRGLTWSKAARLTVSHGCAWSPTVAGVLRFLAVGGGGTRAPRWCPARFGGAGQVWRATPFATPCVGTAVDALVERLPRGGLPAPACFPHVCAASWTATGPGGQNPGGTRAGERHSDAGPARLRDVGTGRQGLAACWSKSHVVPQWPAFGTDLGTPGPGDGGVLGQARRCSWSEAQPRVAPILGRAGPNPGQDRAGSRGSSAAGCAGFRRCQSEAGGPFGWHESTGSPPHAAGFGARRNEGNVTSCGQGLWSAPREVGFAEAVRGWFPVWRKGGDRATAGRTGALGPACREASCPHPEPGAHRSRGAGPGAQGSSLGLARRCRFWSLGRAPRCRAESVLGAWWVPPWRGVGAAGCGGAPAGVVRRGGGRGLTDAPGARWGCAARGRCVHGV